MSWNSWKIISVGKGTQSKPFYQECLFLSLWSTDCYLKCITASLRVLTNILVKRRYYAFPIFWTCIMSNNSGYSYWMGSMWDRERWEKYSDHFWSKVTQWAFNVWICHIDESIYWTTSVYPYNALMSKVKSQGCIWRKTAADVRRSAHFCRGAFS